VTAPARRASLHETLTHAWVALDDPDLACAYAHAALDEGKAHGLVFPLEHTRRVRRTFPPRWNVLAPVIELDERLTLAH
jgi:hypothetical protein